MGSLGLGVVALELKLAGVEEGSELFWGEVSEAQSVGLDDFLTASDLVLSASESLFAGGDGLLRASDGDEWLVDLDTSDGACWLAESVTHTGLQSICTGAGEHFLLADDVEWVNSDSHVEAVLAGLGHNVLVAGNTACLEGFRGNLLLFPAEEVNALRKSVNSGALVTKVEVADLWIWNTTAESALWIWLSGSVTCTTCWTATHFATRKEVEFSEWTGLRPEKLIQSTPLFLLMARVRTKTVKRAARKLVEVHCDKFTQNFEENKQAVIKGKLAKIPTKRLRNKIVGYTTRIMVRLQKGPVNGVNLKLQEEERQKRDNYVPKKSYFEVAQSSQSVETAEMLKAIGFSQFVRGERKGRE